MKTNDTYANSMYHWQNGKAVVQVIDINAHLAGDITDRFESYTQQKNRALIENSFRKTSFLRNYTDAALDRLANFPDSMARRP